MMEKTYAKERIYINVITRNDIKDEKEFSSAFDEIKREE